jgi:hypothetical protein
LCNKDEEKMNAKEILSLKTLISNVDVKLATISDKQNQILCVVTCKDQIVLRYVTEAGEIILKKLSWFTDNDKIIQDVAFDPSSTWLLVLCLDNTLHIVPAVGIVDKSIQFKCIFTPNEITSFIVPFVGPHECINSQKCPNLVMESSMELLKRHKRILTQGKFNASRFTSNAIYNQIYCDSKPAASLSQSSSFHSEECESNQMETPTESTTISSCPFPTAVIWWKTHLDENRAILGYSDGCVVVVLLANNCPFIGNTVIEKSFIEKFVICRDSALDTVTLMINTGNREQFKMLLEQKSTSYTFPSEVKGGDSDWEVVSSSSSATDLQEKENIENEATASTASDLKSRLLSLRDLGAKKIGNLKLKLAESRIKREKEKSKGEAHYAMMSAATVLPELLTTPAGPFFIVQKEKNKNMISALHPYSDTLSVSFFLRYGKLPFSHQRWRSDTGLGFLLSSSSSSSVKGPKVRHVS